MAKGPAAGSSDFDRDLFSKLQIFVDQWPIAKNEKLCFMGVTPGAIHQALVLLKQTAE